MNNVRKVTDKASVGKVMFVFILATALLMGTMITAYANGTSDAISNLADYIFEIGQVVGVIMAFFGLVQIGISLSQTHDATQRMAGILLAAGGAVIFFAEDILGVMGITT